MADNDALGREALRMHASGRPGKVEVTPTKALTTQYHLSLAYSPGVAVPCLEIEKDPGLAYDYTAKGNMVAVISNGTAVLGLGNIGALASKPVMEGKAVLFKRFADVDGIDLEVDTEDVDKFIECVRYLGKSFGGINLEDIKAPECFVIEDRLRELLDIPVFHDDQHGTAIISAAGLINALHLTDRRIRDCRMVVNGAGASGIACVELFKSLGLPAGNIIMCDTRGVVHRGRTEGMNQWKSAHAIETDLRTLDEAMVGADIAFGLSVKGAFTKSMIASMAPAPIIFALANPDPEITPEEVREVRQDAIICTGRSDYPNQVNNVLGFPYIFRGALDVRATTVNDAMKIAAAEALAELAREDVPDEAAAAYPGKRLQYGPDYVIPVPFDPRLVVKIPEAVARAAIDSGVSRKPIEDWGAYRAQLAARLDPTSGSLQRIHAAVQAAPRRVVFAEGEEERAIRAALAFRSQGFGTPVLVGREGVVLAEMERLGIAPTEPLEIHNARLSERNEAYIDHVYGRLQRKGHLLRDVARMVHNDRNYFAACMVATGEADAMVTGLTRSFQVCFGQVSQVLEPERGSTPCGITLYVNRNHSVFVADTAVNELPGPEQMADIAVAAAGMAGGMGVEPRVAILSYSNFGNPSFDSAAHAREAVVALDRRGVDFEYEGEMSADIALDAGLMNQLYPFARLSGPANVLVMPGLHSANISAKLLQRLGGGAVIGPVLVGLAKPVQIVQMGAKVSEIVNMAVFAAHGGVR